MDNTPSPENTEIESTPTLYAQAEQVLDRVNGFKDSDKMPNDVDTFVINDIAIEEAMPGIPRTYTVSFAIMDIPNVSFEEVRDLVTGFTNEITKNKNITVNMDVRSDDGIYSIDVIFSIKETTD